MPDYASLIMDLRGLTDQINDGARPSWTREDITNVTKVLMAEHERAEAAERRLKGEPLPVPEKCGAPAVGGPCVLAKGHNRGKADVPWNHSTGPAHRSKRANEIGRRLAEIAGLKSEIQESHALFGKGRTGAFSSATWNDLDREQVGLREELWRLG